MMIRRHRCHMRRHCAVPATKFAQSRLIFQKFVDLRHRITEANRGGIPDVWDISMKASSKIMGNAKAWTAATKGVKAGRVIAGKDRKIHNVPIPLANRHHGT